MSKRLSERERLTLFRALPHGDIALRDSQDLMAYPFFSLAKSPRIVPIRFEAGGVSLTVEGVPEHGIATIWDADVLIWAASQIIQAKKEGVAPSRLIVATPYEILRFAQRGTGRSDYLALRAALDRLQSTTVATTLRQRELPRLRPASWSARESSAIEFPAPPTRSTFFGSHQSGRLEFQISTRGDPLLGSCVTARVTPAMQVQPLPAM